MYKLNECNLKAIYKNPLDLPKNPINNFEIENGLSIYIKFLY